MIVSLIINNNNNNFSYKIKGVTRRDRIRNADIYDEFKIKPIIETIQTDQLRWFGHVMRRDEETTAKKVLNLKVKGKRPRGRPRTSWIKYIDNILKGGLKRYNKCISYESIHIL